MTFTHALSTNRYGEADLIVSTTASNGTHTTLASAMAAAVSGQTIFLRSSVTENVTITPGVNIVAFVGSAETPTVSITGKLTMTGAGTSTISGIRLTTNSDFAVAVTGSAASVLYIEHCYLDCLNNNFLSYSSSNAGSLVYINNCLGNIGTTGIALFSHSSTGTLRIIRCHIENGGGSSTASTCSAGLIALTYSLFNHSITSSGTSAFGGSHSNTDTAAVSSTAFTFGGSGSNGLTECHVLSGSASAISISSAATIVDTVINSTNTNAITGVGSITYGGLFFDNTSSNINVTTQTVIKEGPSRTIGSSNSGNTNTLTVTNSSNTSSSNANIVSTVGGSTANDPTYQSIVSGVTTWTWGADNSVSDNWVLAASAALGTSNALSITTAGVATLTGNLLAPGISFDSGSNTLTSFTEGTYSPTVLGSGTAGTPTYTVQLGRYVQFNKRIFVYHDVIWSAISGSPTGNLLSGGLPFTVENTSSIGSSLSTMWGNSGALVSGAGLTPLMRLGANSTQISACTYNQTTGVVANLAVATSGSMVGVGWYTST